MRSFRILLAGVPALLAAVLGGCDGPVSPLLDPDGEGPALPEDSLVFLRLVEQAPPVSDTVVSFWAVRGENREIEIEYLPHGEYRGGTFVYFKVPGNSLHRHPDGRSFARGDSVRITIRVVDTREFRFEFSPAGLKFDPDKPAELRVFYDWVERDLNGDGIIDEEERRIYESFGLWRQPASGERWRSLRTDRDENSKRARADVRSFTRYALASN